MVADINIYPFITPYIFCFAICQKFLLFSSDV